MKIRLTEIPAEGRTYEFDRISGELNHQLEDMIGDRAFNVDLTIRPIGNAFEMRGHLKTSVPEVCSTCGYDFDLAVERSINEILFEDMEDDRKAHSVHGNQSVDFLNESGPSMTPYRGDVFDPGEYVHEFIGFVEPFYPTCGPDGSCLHKAEVDRIRADLEREFEKADEVKAPHPGFAALKGLNLGKKN